MIKRKIITYAALYLCILKKKHESKTYFIPYYFLAVRPNNAHELLFNDIILLPADPSVFPDGI